ASGIAVDRFGTPIVIGTFARTVDFPEGSVTSTYGRDPFIWKIGEPPLQSDTSDALFSIVVPVPRSQDVDLGKVVVGASRDSVVETFIGNAKKYPFTVREIQILGPDASDFSLVSGLPPFDVPGNASHPVEFRFRPSSAGTKSAQLRIVTKLDTLVQTIR